MKAGVYKTPNGNLIYVAKDRTIKATSLSPSSWPGTKVSHRSKDDTVLIEGTGYRCTRHADVPNGCTDHQALVDSMHTAANLEPGQRVVDYGTKLARVEEIDNPADVARAITENCAEALGVEVDHESFDKAAEELAKPVTDDEFDRAKAVADDPYKRMAEHMRHVGEAATGAAEAVRRFVGAPPALAAPYGGTDLVERRKKFSASLRKQGFRVCHTRSARKHKKQGHTVIPLHGGWYAWRPAHYLRPYQRAALDRMRESRGLPSVTIVVPASIGKSELASPKTALLRKMGAP